MSETRDERGEAKVESSDERRESTVAQARVDSRSGESRPSLKRESSVAESSQLSPHRPGIRVAHPGHLPVAASSFRTM